MMMARNKLVARAAATSAIACLALAAAPSAADVKNGVDAWSQGDFSRAVSEWKLPAEKGDADALFNLAQAYRLGRGVPADIGRARELYAEAAMKGHVKAADNYGLLLFQQGEQGSAMPLIREAADRGDPRAQYILGLSHFNADYAEKDWVRAYALLTLSQSAGLPQAKPALAQMDKYIPMEQRQQAQLLARELETRAGKRRAADLAALDLGKRSTAPSTVAARTPAPAPAPVQVAQPTRPTRVAAVQRQAAPKPAPKPATKSVTPSATRPATRGAARNGNWKVQLGAFGVRSNANRLWSKLSGYRALAGTTKVLVPAGKVTRLQAKGYNSRAEAQAACNSLKAQGQACMVTR